MRKITREPIDMRATSYLAKRQGRVNKGEAVDPAWKSARKTKTMQRVFNTLVSMASKREGRLSFQAIPMGKYAARMLWM